MFQFSLKKYSVSFLTWAIVDVYSGINKLQVYYFVVFFLDPRTFAVKVEA